MYHKTNQRAHVDWVGLLQKKKRRIHWDEVRAQDTYFAGHTHGLMSLPHSFAIVLCSGKCFSIYQRERAYK